MVDVELLISINASRTSILTSGEGLRSMRDLHVIRVLVLVHHVRCPTHMLLINMRTAVVGCSFRAISKPTGGLSSDEHAPIFPNHQLSKPRHAVSHVTQGAPLQANTTTQQSEKYRWLTFLNDDSQTHKKAACQKNCSAKRKQTM